MPKWKAYTLGVICVLCAAIAVANGYPSLALFFLPPAAVFAAISWYKIWRDHQVLLQAEEERQAALAQPQPVPLIENTITCDLFVPDPLDK